MTATEYTSAGARGRFEGIFLLAAIRGHLSRPTPGVRPSGAGVSFLRDTARSLEAGTPVATQPALALGPCRQVGGRPSGSMGPDNPSVRTSAVPGAGQSRTAWPGRNKGHFFPFLEIGFLLALALPAALRGSPAGPAARDFQFTSLQPASSVDYPTALRMAQWLAVNLTLQTGRPFFIEELTGRSMEPASPERAVIVCEKVRAAECAPGDWVVYAAPGIGRVAHRIFDRDGGGWWTIGDNNMHADRFNVTDANLIGRVAVVFYPRRATK